MRDAETIYAADSLEGRVLRGDPEAIGEIIRWIALVLVGPRFWRLRSDWSDLHQECLRRLLASLHEARFDSSRDFRAYVQSLARYTALEALDRLSRGSTKVNTRTPSNPAAVETDAVRRLLARSVMDRVPEGCRDLFREYFYEQRSHEEIAVLLAIPVGTVKSRMFRCMQTAHRLMGVPRRRPRYEEIAE